MAARVLQRGELEQKLGNRILASSGRMQRLINQVLDVSRVQNGLGLGLSRLPVDLPRLIEDIVDETHTAHPHTRYDADLPPTLIVAVDSDRIAQLLSNVLNNAHHHGTRGSPISISLRVRRRARGHLIRNQGPPIDDITAAHLYDPFKRPVTQNISNRTGMGLGLYIAHAIVVEHGGAIRYDYELGHVAFTIELPLGLASNDGEARTEEDPCMNITNPDLHTSRQFQGLILPAHPTSGTEDDDDDRDDERAGENEARVRAIDEGTETPEEFEVDYDDKDRLAHPEDDDDAVEEFCFASGSDRAASRASWCDCICTFGSGALF